MREGREKEKKFDGGQQRNSSKESCPSSSHSLSLHPIPIRCTHVCPHRDHRRQNRVPRRAPSHEELPVCSSEFCFLFRHRQRKERATTSFLCTHDTASLIRRAALAQLVPFRVPRGRRERGAAERRRRRAGRDSTASGDDDTRRRCRDEATSARSSPRGRRQRGRGASREQGCHGGGQVSARAKRREAGARENSKRKGERSRPPRSWRLERL